LGYSARKHRNKRCGLATPTRASAPAKISKLIMDKTTIGNLKKLFGASTLAFHFRRIFDYKETEDEREMSSLHEQILHEVESENPCENVVKVLLIKCENLAEKIKLARAFGSAANFESGSIPIKTPNE
jgi:hypothetical protein